MKAFQKRSKSLGKEEIQEVLTKRLYLCQFILGLSLARVGDGQTKRGGNFLCKLFDVFTPFSAGLIYLMYAAFERISLHKPHTSRPANSERFVVLRRPRQLQPLFFRYIFCENLTQFGATTIKGYLSYVNTKIDELRRTTGEDVIKILPIEQIQQDENFNAYFKAHISK